MENIKIYKDILTQEDLRNALNFIKEYEEDNRLIPFDDNNFVKSVPYPSEHNEFMSKYSEISIQKHKEINNLDHDIYTCKMVFCLWNPGSHAGPHIDNHYGYEFLKYSTVIYLNNDFEGGEIYFPNLGFIHSPKENEMITFPSVGNEYIHGVQPILSGKRYSIALWHTDEKEKEAEYLKST